MRAALIARWRRHWLLLVYVGSVVLVTFQFAGRGAANNVQIFRWSFFHLLAGQDIYWHYPDLYFDVFKYSPTWALLFAPFALAPPAVGFFLWDLVAALLLYHAVQRLLPGPEARLALAITFFEFLAAMQHASSTNSVVAALIILAFVGLEEGRQGLAAVCIGLGTLMKLYPLAALTFALFHRRKVRFALLVTAVLALLIALPLLVTSPTALLAQWRSWGGVLAWDTVERGGSVMYLMHHWVGADWPNWPVQLAGTLVLLLPLALRRDRWRDPHFRRLVLCSVLLYCLIFNHQAERPSTVVGFTGIAIWYAMSPRAPWRTFVMALAFVLVSVLHSGLVPWPLRRNVLPKFQLIAIACLSVWVVIQVELLRSRASGASSGRGRRFGVSGAGTSGGDAQPGQMGQPAGNAAEGLEKSRCRATRFLERLGDGCLHLFGIEQRRIGCGVHGAAVAGEQLAEGGLVAAGPLLHEPPIGRLGTHSL